MMLWLNLIPQWLVLANFSARLFLQVLESGPLHLIRDKEITMKRLPLLPAVFTALVFAFIPVALAAEVSQLTTKEIPQLDIN